MVEVVKIGHDDRNRKCDGQNSCDCAQRSDELAPRSDGHHVAVSDGRHGDDRPPEGVRDAAEVGVVRVDLGEVDCAGEEDDADDQREDEEAELAEAGPDRHAEDLETLRMTRQFEDSKDAHQPHDAQYRQRRHLRVDGLLAGDEQGGEGDEVGHDGDQIDDVHDVPEERQMVGAGGEPDRQFGDEPDDTAGLDHEERLVEGRRVVLLDRANHSSVLGCLVHDPVPPEVRQCLHAEYDDRHEDDHDRDEGDDPGRAGALRILEQQPDLPLDLVLRHDHRLLFRVSLALLKFFYGRLVDSVEFQLFDEHFAVHDDRPPKPAAALVIIQDGVETGSVPVEEVLVPLPVVVASSSFRVAEEGLGEALDSRPAGLVPQTAHVYHHTVVVIVDVVVVTIRLFVVVIGRCGDRDTFDRLTWLGVDDLAVVMSSCGRDYVRGPSVIRNSSGNKYNWKWYDVNNYYSCEGPALPGVGVKTRKYFSWKFCQAKFTIDKENVTCLHFDEFF